MYRHIQFADDGVTVMGISFLSAILTDTEGVIYLPVPKDGDDEFADISLGWRYIDGKWQEPSPPSELELAHKELHEVNYTLKQMWEDEQMHIFCGEITVQPLSGGTGIKEALVKRRTELIEKIGALESDA